MVIKDSDATVVNGARNWGSGLHARRSTRAVALQAPSGDPIANLRTPQAITADARQRGKLDFLSAINRDHAGRAAGNTELEARIESYELAFRMQAEAPEAVDLDSETEATQVTLRHGSRHRPSLRPQLPAGPPARRARRALRAALPRRRQQVGRHTKIEDNHTRALRQRSTSRSPACSRI